MSAQFKFDNKKIKEWLESRTWLNYYGTTRPNSGIFYPIAKEYVKYCEKDDEYGFPRYQSSDLPEGMDSQDVSQIYLKNARSNCYTWAFPSVVLKIWGYEKDVQDGKYETEIYFCYQRGEVHYEQVFNGFISDLKELLMVMRMVGVHENYITGCQEIECE